MSDKEESLSVESKLENLPELTAYVEQKIPYPDLKNFFCIVLDELFSNIVKFSYPSQVGNVRLSLQVSESKVSMVIEDSGIPFDPFSTPSPDTAIGVENRKIGGLGILIVKELMDEVNYKRFGDKNIVVVSKNVKN